MIGCKSETFCGCGETDKLATFFAVEPLVHKIVSKTVCSEPSAPQMTSLLKCICCFYRDLWSGRRKNPVLVVDPGSAGVLLLLGDC